MSDARILHIWRHGRLETKRSIELPDGAQGNIETLGIAAKIVREDAQNGGLKAFAQREILRGGGIEAAYAYCRDQVVYDNRDEVNNTETVADLFSAVYGLNADHAAGDCTIKSTALATLLVFLNLRPFFVAIRQIPNADFFNHVFVGVNGPNGFEALDPTPPEFRPGDELSFYSRLDYMIFS